MQKMFFMFILILLLASISTYAKDFEVKKKVGEYDVEVKIDKNPPVVGDNNVEIEITDSAGRYIKDAKVMVNYSMPAMPGM
ncbi:MAG: hypothetical protein AB1638_03355, partial [Nitrospirota bacterium]